jgi:hypothetical protein
VLFIVRARAGTNGINSLKQRGRLFSALLPYHLLYKALAQPPMVTSTYTTPQCSTQLVVQPHIDLYNMTQLTYHECFEPPHPTMPVSNLEKTQKQTDSTSSDTVKKQNSPKILIEEEVDSWVKIANNFLQSPEAKSPSSRLSNFALVPSINSLLSKFDVQREADRYLMLPLISALRTKYPNLELQETAGPPPQTYAGIKTKNEMYITDGKDIILVVEYTPCGYIHYEEFKKAFRNEKDLQEELDALQAREMASTLEEGSNAMDFIKKGTAYSQKTGCKHVALCDYEHLVLLRYLEDGSLDSAYATVVPRDKFLKALLGFGIDACQKVIDRVQ